MTFKCRFCPPTPKGTVRVKKSSGKSNVRSHVTYNHTATWQKTMSQSTYGGLDAHLIPSAFGQSAFSWFEKKCTREYGSFKGLSHNQVKQFMHLLRASVVEDIMKELPDKFGVVLDGWTHMSEHFIALFAVYVNAGDRKKVLLSMTPLIKDTSLANVQGVDELQPSPETDEVVQVQALYLLHHFYVADNCSVNKKMAIDMKVPLLRCASHRFNLAVQDLMKGEFADLLAKVQKVMLSCKALNNAAELKKLTALKPKLLQTTRWSSAFEMLRRFQKLLPSLEQMPKRAKLKMSSKAMLKRMERSLPLLTKWQSVTKYLQRRDCSAANIRVIFDEVLSEWPSMESRLASEASIVHWKEFEHAAVALQQRVALTAADKVVTAETFAEDTVTDGDIDDGMASAYDPILKQLPPTSNGVERFFSAAKQVLGTQRKAMSPANLEDTLFLNVNARFWDINKVAVLIAADTSGGIGDGAPEQTEVGDDDDDDVQGVMASDASDSDQDMGEGLISVFVDGDSSDGDEEDDDCESRG
ncbi:hypothetical protein H257_10910 [Aphanomyces astaci]|uniref:HAT C-terminal dimerisation domain-containing protein n=1 Tax=Aphanomyces astaci TaxID=112090 RepID=W4G6F2_APHAT|nr:hypothetical protein H257_10910 [Aphanomyces astaci]ETV74871.1 hypothetical protein H257_10910 [Aphanomyces astaci]|eukprot:XP_009835958.1 hypothetical protein H257_10910 [Aphanomyces astaci]